MDNSSCSYIKVVLQAIILASVVVPSLFVRASDVTIDGRVVGCGDGIVDVGESCDVSNLNAQTCSTLGFSGGMLSCTSSCAFDTSACTVRSGGGGGGGGGSKTESAKSLVAVQGKTAPLALVYLLVDGTVLATTTTDQLGFFNFSARNLPRGTYIFEAYSVDEKGGRTATFSVTSNILSRSVVKIEGIFLGPTLSSDMVEVQRGSLLTLSGYAVPNTLVTISLKDRTGHTTLLGATSSPAGIFLVPIDTTSFNEGFYAASAQASVQGSIGLASYTIWFTIGSKNVARTSNASQCPNKGDINHDCRVNLTDFSILLFWYERPVSASFAVLEKESLSGDGRANLTDFSIMLFNWTG